MRHYQSGKFLKQVRDALPVLVRHASRLQTFMAGGYQWRLLVQSI
jgi:hypothetical protein